MAMLQVANIDDRLYDALQARAASDNRSIGQELELILREFLARPHCDPQEATEALLALAGSWQDQRTAEEIIADLRSLMLCLGDYSSRGSPMEPR